MKEREIIDSLREAFPDAGIGDDAAVLPTSGGELLLAADAVVEGVHFRRDYSTLRQAVEKVITSNVSDIYAMGGVPDSVLVTSGLPEGFSPEDLGEIQDGVREGCETYGLRLAGGDTVLSPGAIFFNVAILGSVAGGCAVPRSGARPGDLLVLFGACGRSLTGMLLLKSLQGETEEGIPVPEALARNTDALAGLIPDLAVSTEPEEIGLLCGNAGLAPEAVSIVKCIKHHLTPLTRPLAPALLGGDGPAAAGRTGGAGPAGAVCDDSGQSVKAADGEVKPVAAAMIDVSDGLARDLRNLCRESGVGADVNEEALPVPAELAAILPGSGELCVKLALASGEEYVMLAAVRGADRDAAIPGGTVIGSITEAASGVVLVTRDGAREPLPEVGYEHSF